ncbi:MAG: type II toxin-antitoxin system VapC family toxin [Gemmatimonadaceae bacterium]
MKLLLDTNIVLWWQGELGQLREDIRTAILVADAVYVSAASAWEAEIKRSSGKLAFPHRFTDVLEPNGFLELPVTVRHAHVAAKLPLYHRDPFDRMLVAQAIVEGCTLVTADRHLAQYGVPILDARS